MKKNMMRKNVRQSILHSMGRFLAIVAIIALGAGMFVGLRTTKTDMVATGQLFTDGQNMFDLRLVSAVGWDTDAPEKIAALDGVVDAEGLVSVDALLHKGTSTDETVYKLYAIPQTINRVYLLGGRMPQAPNECLADGFHATDDILGTTFTVSGGNDEETRQMLLETTFTVVGYVSTPLYMDMSRGNTTLGNGTVDSYLYLQPEAFQVDYLTEIHVTIPGEYDIYSQAYDDAMAAAAEKLEKLALPIAQARLDRLYGEGLSEYEDGLAQYAEGLADFEAGKLEAQQALQEGYDALVQAEAELADGKRQVQSNAAQLADGQRALDAGRTQLNQSREATYAQLAAGEAELDAGAAQIATGLEEANGGLAQLEAAIAQLDAAILQLENAPQTGAVPAQLALLKQQRQEALEQSGQITATIAMLQQAQQTLDANRAALAAARAQADSEFAAAQAQLDDNQRQLDAGRRQLEAARRELAKGEAELADGWKEYEEGKLESEQTLADAAQELEDARVQLADAKEALGAMPQAAVYVLDRNTNVGYVALDSNSDIVEGVSTVFPAFFLLIAALVCITTMTRMVEEERTQIGTLKAMGYSDAAIIGKYLFYAGSAAVIGCGFGVFAGSVIFPLILWDAYSIMMLLRPNLELVVDVPLCLLVLGAYTAVTLLVTWYTCRRTLQEVPAELIRPKPPTSGKKIFLERLPFWNRISFLNKVMLRNILRYRQRLLMMLVGIGGCTALLLTGFGFRDSIVDIVSYQYNEITLHDMELRYEEAVTPAQRQALLEAAAPYAQDVAFYHQSSLELDSGHGVKDILMIMAGEEMSRFIDFHSGEEKLAYPANGEALLSVGMATNLGISVGDTVILRDADMRQLEVRISGLYDNYVHNYIVLSPETAAQQWGEELPMQLSCLILKDGVDPHEAAAALTGTEGVLSITVNDDMAQMIGSMLEALDLVVLTIVVCAGLLAGTVLYNLTNINITERVREIATIKVLGFHARESAAYVFKENLLLSFLGTLVGLPGGILLLEFVMNKIQIDMVWMPARLEWPSYIFAMVLTMLCACLVDFLLYFKLEKINMAEALKSVE